MESSIAVFLLRQSACELLPTIALGHVVPPRPVPSFASLPLGFPTPHYFVTILLLFSYDLVIILLLFHFYFTTSIYPRVQRAQSQRASESFRALQRGAINDIEKPIENCNFSKIFLNSCKPFQKVSHLSLGS